MWRNLGSKTLGITIAGYVALISYTWPQGFVPIVAVQSLPILLIGFVSVLLSALLILGLLFLPFWMYVNDEILREFLYGEAFGELPSKFKNKRIRIPLSQLIRDLRKTHGIPATIFQILSLLAPLPFCYIAWFGLSSLFDDRILILPVAFIMWLAFKSLTGALKAKSLEEANPCLLGILLFFVFLPSCSMLSKKPQIEQLFSPNGLVRDALKITGLGGGILVEVQTLRKGEPPESIRGHLLFSDGQTIWIKPCSDYSVTRIQVSASVVKFYKQDTCDKSS